MTARRHYWTTLGWAVYDLVLIAVGVALVVASIGDRDLYLLVLGLWMMTVGARRRDVG